MLKWLSKNWADALRILSAAAVVLVGTVLYLANEHRAIEQEIVEGRIAMEERMQNEIQEIQEDAKEMQKKLHELELELTKQEKDIEHLEKDRSS